MYPHNAFVTDDHRGVRNRDNFLTDGIHIQFLTEHDELGAESVHFVFGMFEELRANISLTSPAYRSCNLERYILISNVG